MRQTIECIPCSKHKPVNQKDQAKAIGFPLRLFRCDVCNAELTTRTLAAAVGMWRRSSGIERILEWEWDFLRKPEPGEVDRYHAAELAAKELRNEDENGNLNYMSARIARLARLGKLDLTGDGERQAAEAEVAEVAANELRVEDDKGRFTTFSVVKNRE